MDDGGVVEYDGKTYKMADGKLTVDDGDIKKTYTGDETTNILEPTGESSAYIQVAEGDAIPLAEGIEAMAGADEVVFGTTEEYDSDAVVARMTGDSDTGDYKLSDFADGAALDTTDMDSDDTVTVNPADSEVVVGSATLTGGEATINGDDTIDLGDGVEVTGAEDDQAFNVEPKAAVSINGKNFANTSNYPVEDVTATDDGLSVGDRLIETNDEDYTVKAAADSDGNITDVAIEGVSSGASIGGEGVFDIVTDGAGSFTIGDNTYTVGDDESVTFTTNYDSDTEELGVDAISGLESGAVTGNFEDPITINRDGNEIEVDGDDEVTVEVEGSKGKNIKSISGIDGEEVTIASAGGAKEIGTTSDGAFTFGDDSDTAETYTITEGDEADGVTFELKNGEVTGISGLDGSVELGPDVGTIEINDDKIVLAGGTDPVTLTTGSDGSVAIVEGLQGAVDGLESALVGAVDSEVTVNGARIAIDEDDDEFGVAVGSDGKVAGVIGVNDGAIIESAPKMNVTTEEEGTFTFGSDSDTAQVFTTAGDDEVTFVTDKYSNVTGVDDLTGTLVSSEDIITVNGAALAFDTVDSDTEVSIVGGEDGVSSIVGLGDGDSVTAPSTAAVAMPEGTLTINKKPFTLEGDGNGAVVTGDSISGLDKNATLTVGAAGTYTFASDKDTETLTLKVGDVVLVDENGDISVYDENDFNLNGNTEDILEQLDSGFSKDDYTDKIVNRPLADSDTVEGATYYDSDATYNGNLWFDLDNEDSVVAVEDVDFSSATGKKLAELGDGDQTVKFGDAGKNVAIVNADATGQKEITLGNGGDVAVIENGGNADVTVAAGAGKDSIVAGEDVTVKTNDSGTTKVTPMDGATITFDGYDGDTDYANGTGVQTDLGDIASAIANNSIILGDGMASIDGAGAVVFEADADSEAEGATKANFYDKSGNKVKVGFTGSAGGEVDMSGEKLGTVMKGNYVDGRPSDKSKTGDSILLGGSGNDTIYAGGNDAINAGAGYNTINLTAADKRGESEDGAIVAMLDETGKNSVNGFRNGGFGVHDDKVEFDSSKIAELKAEYKDGKLTIKTDRAATTLNDVTAGDNPGNNSDVSYAEVALVNDKGDLYKVAVAEAGKDILASDDKEQMALDYLGDKSGVDFSNTNDTLAVNLGTTEVANFVDSGHGTYGGEDIVFQGINKVEAGKGTATLVGADDANDTLIAGSGANTIWGGHGGNDLLVGYADTNNKDDSTEFFFTEGSGKDTVTNFKFSEPDGYNNNADKINTNFTAVGEVLTDGSDVVITLSDGADRLRIENAAGKDFQIQNIYDTVTAQVNDTMLTYDGTADYFLATGKNAVVSVGADSADEAEIWLNNDARGDAKFFGDIKTLDASAFDGKAELVGNDNNNVIIAGSAGNSLWGGNNGNDSLIGGEGDDLFWYERGNGNDTISGAGANDTINLYGITLDDFAVTGNDLFDANGNVVAKFKNGDTLTIENGRTNGATYTYDGTTWTVEDGNWVKK